MTVRMFACDPRLTVGIVVFRSAKERPFAERKATVVPVQLVAVLSAFISVCGLMPGRLIAAEPAKVVLDQPLPYQVIQREGFEPRRASIHEPGGPELGHADIPFRAARPVGVKGDWQYRLVLHEHGFGQSFDWMLLDVGNDETIVKGLVEVPAGGWYRLELRCVDGAETTASGSVAAIGVGEVFLVAGQSYAGGWNDEVFKVTDPSRGVSTYGGNAGTKGYPSFRATNDGMFGYATASNRNAVRLTDATDGLSNTILFGERIVGDPNLDSFMNAPIAPAPSPPFSTLSSYAAWAGNFGPNAGAGTLLSAGRSLNYGHPTPYIPPVQPPFPLPPIPPPIIPWPAFSILVWDRTTAYGSRHTGGVNLALGDASVRFARSSLDIYVLQCLSTRGGGEVIPGDW